MDVRILAGFITATLLLATASIIWIGLQASKLLDFEWTMTLTLASALSPSYVLFKPILAILSEKRVHPISPQQPSETQQLREFTSNLEKQLNDTRRELEEIKTTLQKIQETKTAEPAKITEKVEPPPPTESSEKSPEQTVSPPSNSTQESESSTSTQLRDEIRILIDYIRKVKHNLQAIH